MTVFQSLYSFTDLGMQSFERVFSGEMEESALVPIDPAIAQPVAGTIQFTISRFETTKDMAKAVIDALGSAKLPVLLTDAGLWGWLTFVLRDQVFRKDVNNRRKIGERFRWFPGDPNDWQKGQRHIVRMPVLLLHSFGNDVDHLLCTDPWILPEIREQLTSQQEMFHPTFQRVARKLYFDDAKGGLKRGAGGKGGGSPRRLAKVRQQLDVTWDLEDLEEAAVLAALPKEFDRYKSTI